MASGLPTVATSVGGVPEAIEDGVTGLLVPSGDEAALADALFHVGSHADEARAMGLAGRRRVESLFDVRRTVSQYESIYQEILRAAGVAVAA
jgi:glycosyltransferase involved in cell wall biosynthesis